MSELRDQHKAFAEWFLQQNPIAPNVEDMAWSAWKAALAQPEAEPVAWTVACDGSAVEARLTKTAANLIAQNLREKNRARDFDWRVHPLYLHPPQPCAQRYALTECKALAQPETTAANYDLDAMAEAFSRVIEAHHSSTHPFHNPIDADAKIALRTLRGLIPGIKACARPPRDKWREAVIGALEICMILNDANRDDPERAMSDLMEWEPRDEWRPASEPPEDGRDVVVWCAQERRAVHGMYVRRHPPVVGLVDGWVAPDASKLTHWRDVTPPTEGER